MLSWMIAGFLGMVVSIGLWVWCSSRTFILDYYDPSSKRYYKCKIIKRVQDHDFFSMDILSLEIYTYEGDFLGTYTATVTAEAKYFALLRNEFGNWVLWDETRRKYHFLEGFRISN